MSFALTGLTGSVAARGVGIKAGEGRLHPAIELDMVYDSNPGYYPSGDADLNGDMILKIRPGLSLDFPSERVAFQFGAKVGYDFFMGIENEASTDLSTIAGEAQAEVGFNPNGVISVFVEDVFSRTGDPRYSTLSGRLDRTDNEIKTRLQFKPGGGALMFDLAYGFFLDWFDEKTIGNTGYNASVMSSFSHRVYFSGKWKFLPKTAMTVDFDTDLRRYPNSADLAGQTFQNMDLNAIRATVGMLGQISASMSVVLKVGYGDSLLPERSGYSGSDFRSIIGQAEVVYEVGTTHIQGGYVRNFQPVPLYVYFGQDRFYVRLRQQLAGRFLLGGEIGFDLLSYGEGVVANAGSRSDSQLNGGLSFDYHIQDWISVGLDYRFQALFSDYQQPVNSVGVEYNKHAISLHVGVDY